MRDIFFFFIALIGFSCSTPNSKPVIVCTDSSCYGTYIGPEFIKGDDIAHKFSNRMCESVGDKLKALYKAGNYYKVDFAKIVMTTEGMGSGNVTYKISIPFIKVKEKCQAFTSFDHVGGWNHVPALSARKVQLNSALIKNDTLDISDLMKTKEGLQEYWIQWKNKDLQSECINSESTKSE